MPLDPEEILYRRILVKSNDYNEADDTVSDDAFRPGKHDVTGISLFRSSLKTAEEAARGSNPCGYYLAMIRVKDIYANGMTVVVSPDDPSHVEIPELNYADRRASGRDKMKSVLAERLVLRTIGPFNVRTDPPPA